MPLSFLKKLTLTILTWLHVIMEQPQKQDQRTKALTGSHPTYQRLTKSGPLGDWVA